VDTVEVLPLSSAARRRVIVRRYVPSQRGAEYGCVGMTFDDGSTMRHRGHVLIVEDDPDTREMLVMLLNGEGFHAVAAEDGLEALHVLRTVRHREPDTPCLVLLDLRMPRLGGNEFRRAQLGDPVVASVPVAIMSGAVDADEWGRALGAVAVVTKPVDFDSLLAIVRRHCTRLPQL
jgi:CheY-like chemotaxis protein